MTDTEQPEALQLADRLERNLARTASKLNAQGHTGLPERVKELEEDNSILVQGYNAARLEIESLKELLKHKAGMVNELKARLDAIGAGDVEPLRSRCLHKIAEPPADGWLQDGGMLYRLTDERRPQNRDEINVTMADGSRSKEACARRAGELLDRIRAPKAAQPSTGWVMVPVEPTDAMIVHAHQVCDGTHAGDVYRAMIAAAPKAPTKDTP